MKIEDMGRGGGEEEESDEAVSVEGQAEALEKIQKFILKIKTSSENEETIRVQLLHVGDSVDRPLGAFLYQFGDIKELAKEILEEAEEYALELSERIKFVVQARVGTQRLSQAFSLTVNGRDGESAYAEPPTDEGREAQRMKFTKDFAKHSLDTSKAMVRTSQMPVELLYRLLQDEREKTTALEAKLEKALEVREQLLDGKQARDIAYDEYRRKQNRQDQALKMLGPAAKALVAHIAMGQGASPEVLKQMMDPAAQPPQQSVNSPQSSGQKTEDRSGQRTEDRRPKTRRDLLVEALFVGPHALNRDQTVEILNIVTPEQQEILGELYNCVVEDKTREEQEGRRSAAPGPQEAEKASTNGTNGANGHASYAPFGG